MTLVSINFNSH